MEILLSPPLAFPVYAGLGVLLLLVGRRLAGGTRRTGAGTTLYNSGEAPEAEGIAPGFGPYFGVALFFAVLHLGVIVLATSAGAPMAVIYLLGLILLLLLLILG